MSNIAAGPQLKQARVSIGLSEEQAASLLGVETATLRSWEDGESQPDEAQLWDIAETYGRPLAFFFSPVGVQQPVRQDFREAQGLVTRRSTEISKLVTAEFEELCRTRSALETRLGTPRSNILAELRLRIRGIEPAEDLAERVRDLAELSDRPVSIRDLMEEWGVAVFMVNVPGRFSGTSWWHPQFGPAVLINRSDSSGRRQFTMAHELGHLLRLDVQPLCDLNDSVGEEHFANRFAAAFLMPSPDVSQFAADFQARGELGESATKATLAKIARRYGVSILAMSYRLEELQFLPRGFSDQKAQDLDEYRRPAKGARWRKAVRDLGKEYVESVEKAYADGSLSLSMASQLLRIDPQQADELLRPSERDS